MRSTSRSAPINIGLAGLLYLLVAWLFLQIEVYATATDPVAPSVGDLVTLYYPHMRYGFAALSRGELPLWNPYQACGTPFLADPSIGFFYPLYAPFLLLDTARALDLDLVLHLALAGLNLFLLCRHFGLGWAAALLGGLVYAYQGSAMIQVNYPSFLVATAWMPCLFLLAHRVLRAPSRRAVAGLAAVSGLLCLGAYPQHLYFAALALLPFVVVQAVLVARTDGGAALLQRIGLLGLAAALGLGFGLVRILPALDFMQHTWRPPGGLSIELAGMMAIAPQTFLRGVATAAQVSGWLADDLRKSYVGALPLLLALIGLTAGGRRAAALPIAAAGAAAVLYAFGTAGPLYPLMFQLPGGNWFRGPARALAIFGLAVAFLSALGLDRLQARFAAIRPNGPLRTAAGLVLGVLLAAIVADLFRAQVLTGLRPSMRPDYVARNAPLFDGIRARQGFDRTYVWHTFDARKRLFFYADLGKVGLNHGIWSCTDYSVSGLRWEMYMASIGLPVLFPVGYRVIDLKPDHAPLMALAGVRYFVFEGRPPQYVAPEVFAGWTELARDGDVFAYENPGALPRAFVAPRVTVEPDSARLLQQLSGADLRRQAFVEQDLPAPLNGSGESGLARIVVYEPNRVVIETDTPQPGLLVLTDQYDAGWRASVDAAPAAVLRADYLFRGVPLPAGAHRVELVYRPISFTLGAVGTLGSMLAIGVLLLVPVRSAPRA